MNKQLYEHAREFWWEKIPALQLLLQHTDNREKAANNTIREWKWILNGFYGSFHMELAAILPCQPTITSFNWNLSEHSFPKLHCTLASQSMNFSDECQDQCEGWNCHGNVKLFTRLFLDCTQIKLRRDESSAAKIENFNALEKCKLLQKIFLSRASLSLVSARILSDTFAWSGEKTFVQHK